MSLRPTSRAWALLRRLLRVQLRLKVMVGVVVVTLIALVAFDIGAVTTMRRYLISQTDSNLQVALTLTVPRLGAILANGGGPPFPHARPGGGGGVYQRVRPPHSKIPALPGAFDIAFLPPRGQQVTLQIGANGGGRGYNWILSRQTAKVAGDPGPHTVFPAKGKVPLRLLSIHARGGSLVAGTSLDQVAKTINQVELIVIFGSVAVVLLIGLGVFFMLRRGLRPIETMARQADRITVGDLTDRVAPHNPRSEVGRLGAALNGMLARIEADVQEREVSQRQMRRFFADASHELRTPLASLRANAELYQQGALCGPDEVDVVMDRIVLETRRMGRLVDDMLRLARLGDHPGQSQEPVDVTAVVTGCAQRVRTADPARIWQVRIDAGLATVGDEELLRRAMDNLLMNVLVHTPGGTVGSITASAAGDQVTIEVADDGPGVAADKLPHLFERFYRAGARSSRPGSGLGLAIAAEIASAHGGTAEAAAVSPHGLRITLTVPVPRPSEPRSAPELAVSAG
ncbi:MAG TPA: HAMP domain-containing sensor histidine kinase [Streptosporangiaceae bacterium]|jgi:two-component system OmpR family sensor kinase